jgi:hypothetical protein
VPAREKNATALLATSQGILKAPGFGGITLQRGCYNALPKRSILRPPRPQRLALQTTTYSQLDTPKTRRFLFEGLAAPVEPNLDALVTDSAPLDKAEPLAFDTPLPFLLLSPITTFNLALIVDKRVVDDMPERPLIGHTIHTIQSKL